MAGSRRESSLTMDAAWLLAAKTVSFMVSLALPLFLVRHLNQVEFGLYKQAFLIVNSTVTIVPLGFGMSALYFLSREPDKQGHAVLNILIFNLIAGGLACLALIVKPSIVQWIFGGPEMVPYAVAIGLVILFWTIASSFDTIAIAYQDMKSATAIIILIQLTRTAFVLAAGVFLGSVHALVWAAVVQGICQTIGLVLYLKFRFPMFWRHYDAALMRRQLSYALPLGAAGLLYTLQMDLHNYVVSNRFGPALFAVYGIGTAQLPLVNMLYESAASVLIPRISLLQRNHENREIVFLLARAMRKLAAAYLPIYALLMVVGPEFIRFLFTDRYLSSWPVFAVNLSLLPLSIFLMDPLYRAYVEQRYFLIRVRAVLVVVVMVLLWIGTKYFGLVGAIAAVVVVNCTERIVTGIRFGRVLGVTRSDLFLTRDLVKLGVSAAAAAAVAAVIRANMLPAKPLVILLVCGAAFTMVYIFAILLLRIPSLEEKAVVMDRLMPMLPGSLRLRRTQP
jgi:O-antigen/teichoic acid export membrane protein